MQIYTVHHRSEAAGSLTGLADDAVFVKEGFSWPAFFIPFVWLIYKRMWWVLATFVLIQAALAGVIGYFALPETLDLICTFAISLIIGFEGNDLYRWTLSRKRYRHAATVAATGREDAEFRFFSGISRTLPMAGATV